MEHIMELVMTLVGPLMDPLASLVVIMVASLVVEVALVAYRLVVELELTSNRINKLNNDENEVNKKLQEKNGCEILVLKINKNYHLYYKI